MLVLLCFCANETLKRDLITICQKGPQETLNQTINAQPALFIYSTALLNEFKKENIPIHSVAGHSLGELSAYHASGILSFEASLKIIEKRAQYMAESYPSEDSAMAAILGLDAKEIQKILSTIEETIVTANFNAKSQTVISGTKKGMQEASKKLKEKKAKVIHLPVSGAFHSPLMENARIKLSENIKDIKFSENSLPIILNRSAKKANKEELKSNISNQIISPVKW
eukprot:COSAG01_NODE_713_length_14097_cov_15.136448_18_plen_225_part_01